MPNLKLIICTLCKSDFEEINMYVLHMKNLHKAKANIKCGMRCNKMFNTYNGLKKHMLKCSKGQKVVSSDICFCFFFAIESIRFQILQQSIEDEQIDIAVTENSEDFTIVSNNLLNQLCD